MINCGLLGAMILVNIVMYGWVVTMSRDALLNEKIIIASETLYEYSEGQGFELTLKDFNGMGYKKSKKGDPSIHEFTLF